MKKTILVSIILAVTSLTAFSSSSSIMYLGSNGFNFIMIYETIVLGSIVLFLFTVISVLKNRFETATDKLIWFLVVLIPFIGPLLYLFIGRKQRLMKG